MKSGEPAYRSNPVVFSILVIVMWGLVPYLAKSANFAGGFTTMWVNLFSAIGVLAIMTVSGKLPELLDFSVYRRYILLSLAWPLLYSLTYFSVISASSGSLATLLNYLWPLAAVVMLSRSMRIPPAGYVLVSVGFGAVALTLALEGELKLVLTTMLWGLAIPVTQALFNVETRNESKYPSPWVLTLVGAVVTALGSGIYILLAEEANFVNGVTIADLWPLMIIGIGGNSIGFWSFLKAGQLSKTPNQKIGFVLSMFAIPFAQLAFLVLGIERDIKPARFVGVVIVAFALLVFKLWQARQQSTTSVSATAAAD